MSTRADAEVGPTWQVGAVTIVRLAEVVRRVPVGLIFGPAGEAARKQLEPLRGWAADDEGNVLISVHALGIRTGGRTILVDTCYGPGPLPEQLADRCNDGSFVDVLTEAGFGRDDIDIVILTHLHLDHVGWNTILEDGRRVPTFRHARYVLSRAEYEHLREMEDAERQHHGVYGFDSSVETLVVQGVVDFVVDDLEVIPTVRLVSTPGHSRGHFSVLVESAGERALITGDCAHSPLQLADPALGIAADLAPGVAAETRRKLVAKYLETGDLIIGTHFPPPTAGHIRRAADGVTFQPLPTG